MKLRVTKTRSYFLGNLRLNYVQQYILGSSKIVKTRYGEQMAGIISYSVKKISGYFHVLGAMTNNNGVLVWMIGFIDHSLRITRNHSNLQ
jgi:hypothetical protein